MLAYVFWHRPKAGVEIADYERAQRDFHASLDAPSACFRLAELPFGVGGDGYEDWYLVEDWHALGELNAHAVQGSRNGVHDRAASLAGDGWGAVYELVRGAGDIPEGVEWFDKPRGEPSAGFIASRPQASIWRRQLVLGPAAELCAAAPPSPARTPI